MKTYMKVQDVVAGFRAFGYAEESQVIQDFLKSIGS